MSEPNTYKYIGRRYGSAYRQFFVNGTRIRCETVDRAVRGVDPTPPEEVAQDLRIPIEAIAECLHYCEHNEDLLRQEREEDLAQMRAMGLFDPPLVPPDAPPES